MLLRPSRAVLFVKPALAAELGMKEEAVVASREIGGHFDRESSIGIDKAYKVCFSILDDYNIGAESKVSVEYRSSIVHSHGEYRQTEFQFELIKLA